MMCRFETIERGENWQVVRCPRCGTTTGRIPDSGQRIIGNCRPGLGDLVSFWLSVFGITKQRIEWITRKPCGCEERSAKLNTLGERLAAWWRAV